MKDRRLSILIGIIILMLMVEGLLGINAIDISYKMNTMREAMIGMYKNGPFVNPFIYPITNYYATDPNTEKSQAASLVKIGKELEKMNANFTKLIEKLKK